MAEGKEQAMSETTPAPRSGAWLRLAIFIVILVTLWSVAHAGL